LKKSNVKWLYAAWIWCKYVLGFTLLIMLIALFFATMTRKTI